MAEPFSLLVVAPRFPSPIGKADSRTVYHMVDYFQGRGHDVHLCSFHVGDMDRDRAADLASKCTSFTPVELSPRRSKLKMARGLLSSEPFQVWYYRYPEMRKAVDGTIREAEPDIYYSHLLRTAPYLLPHNEAPRVLGMQISYALNYRRLLRHLDGFAERLFYRMENRRIVAYESSIARRFERVLLISPADERAIDETGGLDNVFFNPHGIDVDYYGEDLGCQREPGKIVLNADFEAPTNVDAALYFYEQIFPLVRRQIPDAQLWLVGREPPDELRHVGASDDEVLVTGFVEDLRSYLHRATVAIDPLRVGAGLQNKILVSMAAELPVVATTIANEGIRAPVGKAILLADEPHEFAEHVITLLRDGEKREEIARNGKAWVDEHWTWKYHFERLEEMLNRLRRQGAEAEIEQYYPFE